MTPAQWLDVHAPGFATLTPEERRAIFDFSLLWSFFEARALGTNASPQQISALCKTWCCAGKVKPERLAGPLQHFQQRCFDKGEPTVHFGGLNLRANDHPELVRKVLRGDPSSPEEVFTCLLIVVYRLRNNLFHGTKWSYGIAGQLQNFQQANVTLMEALSIVGDLWNC